MERLRRGRLKAAGLKHHSLPLLRIFYILDVADKSIKVEPKVIDEKDAVFIRQPDDVAWFRYFLKPVE